MSGLLFPKTPTKKRQRKHAKQSIVQPERDRRRCMLCMITDRDYRERTGLQKHHVYMGPLRGMSEAEGFFVWLCPEHHTLGNKSVHRDHETCLMLQRYTQAKYERTHSREEFIELTGRSYL